MIQFIYRPKPDVLDALHNNMVGFTSDFVNGYMEEGVTNQLHHKSLFLACENDYTEESGLSMRNPVAIVAKNESEAITLYGEVTNCDNATVFARLEDRCNGLEVEIV
jgi:hypothetical protein